MKLPISNYEILNSSSYMERNIDANSICPDRGLRAISNIEAPNFLTVVAWIGIFLSIEQAIHSVVLAFHSTTRPKFYTKVHPFVFPTGLGLPLSALPVCPIKSSSQKLKSH